MPRVKHPDWLQQRLVERKDPMKQQKINQIFASVAKPVNPQHDDDGDDNDVDDDFGNGGGDDDAQAPAAEPGVSLDREDSMSRPDV